MNDKLFELVNIDKILAKYKIIGEITEEELNYISDAVNYNLKIKLSNIITY